VGNDYRQPLNGKWIKEDETMGHQKLSVTAIWMLFWVFTAVTGCGVVYHMEGQGGVNDPEDFGGHPILYVSTIEDFFHPADNTA